MALATRALGAFRIAQPGGGAKVRRKSKQHTLKGSLRSSSGVVSWYAWGVMVNPSVMPSVVSDVVVHLGCLDPHGLGGRHKPKSVVVMWIAVHVRLTWSVAGHIERAKVFRVTVGGGALKGRGRRAVGTSVRW